MELANGCVEVFAALIVFVLYIGMRHRKTKDIFERRLSFIIICHILVLLLDALRWFLCEYTEFNVLLIVLSAAPTILSLIGNAAFILFIYSFLSLRSSILNKFVYPLIIQLIFAILVWTIFISINGLSSAVNLQTSFEFLNYHWAYWLGHLSWASVCVLGIVAIFCCRDVLESNELWSLLSYCVFPLIALVLRFFWDGPQIFISISLSLIWIYAVMQRDQQQRLQEQDELLVQSHIAILLSQIQPHFLYNTLTVICGLCDENPKEAKKVTADFADYLRHNLDSLSQNTPIPFLDELQHVKLYLAIEKKRFEEKLNIVYDIKTEIFLLPSLTVQPIVENVVKHGILKRKSGGTITISTQENTDHYEIKICDDGIGFRTNLVKSDGKTHIGIENVRERLWGMCKGTIFIESEIGKGTVVTIRIPKGEEKIWI
ncbi:MAG: histidine kinase [Erysipelotrichaceae bacterium]